MKKEEIEDLIGKEYGRWKILEYDEVKSKKDHRTAFICQCSCENKTIRSVTFKNIKNGISTSCGCLALIAKSNNGKANKKYNKYDLTGSYGIGWTSNTNKEFYFDLEDYDKIKDYCWHEHKDKRRPIGENGYLRSTYGKLPNGGNKYILFHRLIMNRIEDYNIEIDHIDGNPLVNTKSNLRETTHEFNMKNLKTFSTNKTGVNGVVLNKTSNKYIVKISNTYLGRYDNIKDAIKIRKDAEEKYFGEYRRKEE